VEIQRTLGRVQWEFGTCTWRFVTVKHYPSTDPFQDDVWFFAIGQWCVIARRTPDMVEYEL